MERGVMDEPVTADAALPPARAKRRPIVLLARIGLSAAMLYMFAALGGPSAQDSGMSMSGMGGMSGMAGVSSGGMPTLWRGSR